jgi:hypothetical protein
MRARAAAALLLLAAGSLAAAAPPQEDPWTLRVGLTKAGLDGWARTGTAVEKAFAWNRDEGTLAMKGQSGKEPPRIVWPRIAWDRGEFRFQAKKGARKVRVVLVPAAGGKAIPCDFPGSAVKSAAWTDLAVRVGGGKASLLAWEGEAPEAEVASVPLPEGTAVRFGLEAPAGTEAVLTGLFLRRTYEEGPQACEEGFASLFDGEGLGEWVPFLPEYAPAFSVEKGLLDGTWRGEGSAGLIYRGRKFTTYELRFRALWGTTFLMVRALEVPGREGKINRFETAQPNLTDYLDPDDLHDVVVRVTKEHCRVTVDGKQVFEQKVKEVSETSVILWVDQGKRFRLRDLRVRDIGEEPATEPPPGAPPAAPPGGGK